MSDVNTNKFGGALLFILGEFAAAEEEMIEDGGMEVFGEDDQGREGSCEVSINELAQAASDEIKHLTEQLAKANERVRELELHANSIADALGFNAENNNRFATSVICTNIRNLHSFSDCLSRIENAFLMVESETDEFGETSEDVAFSKWGLTPHEYCIEFGKWLNKFAIDKQLNVLDRVESIYMQAAETSEPISFREAFDTVEEQLRKEQE